MMNLTSFIIQFASYFPIYFVVLTDGLCVWTLAWPSSRPPPHCVPALSTVLSWPSLSPPLHQHPVSRRTMASATPVSSSTTMPTPLGRVLYWRLCVIRVAHPRWFHLHINVHKCLQYQEQFVLGCCCNQLLPLSQNIRTFLTLHQCQKRSYIMGRREYDPSNGQVFFNTPR